MLFASPAVVFSRRSLLDRLPRPPMPGTIGIIPAPPAMGLFDGVGCPPLVAMGVGSEVVAAVVAASVSMAGDMGVRSLEM